MKCSQCRKSLSNKRGNLGQVCLKCERKNDKDKKMNYIALGFENLQNFGDDMVTDEFAKMYDDDIFG